jgi:hypothetical protein
MTVKQQTLGVSSWQQEAAPLPLKDARRAARRLGTAAEGVFGRWGLWAGTGTDAAFIAAETRLMTGVVGALFPTRLFSSLAGG